MVGDISIAENIYIACGKTDMRKSIALWQQWFKANTTWISLPGAYSCSVTVLQQIRCNAWIDDSFVI